MQHVTLAMIVVLVILLLTVVAACAASPIESFAQYGPGCSTKCRKVVTNSKEVHLTCPESVSVSQGKGVHFMGARPASCQILDSAPVSLRSGDGNNTLAAADCGADCTPRLDVTVGNSVLHEFTAERTLHTKAVTPSIAIVGGGVATAPTLTGTPDNVLRIGNCKKVEIVDGASQAPLLTLNVGSGNVPSTVTMGGGAHGGHAPGKVLTKDDIKKIKGLLDGTHRLKVASIDGGDLQTGSLTVNAPVTAAEAIVKEGLRVGSGGGAWTCKAQANALHCDNATLAVDVDSGSQLLMAGSSAACLGRTCMQDNVLSAVSGATPVTMNYMGNATTSSPLQVASQRLKTGGSASKFYLHAHSEDDNAVTPRPPIHYGSTFYIRHVVGDDEATDTAFTVLTVCGSDTPFGKQKFGFTSPGDGSVGSQSYLKFANADKAQWHVQGQRGGASDGLPLRYGDTVVIRAPGSTTASPLALQCDEWLRIPESVISGQNFTWEPKNMTQTAREERAWRKGAKSFDVNVCKGWSWYHRVTPKDFGGKPFYNLKRLQSWDHYVNSAEIGATHADTASVSCGDLLRVTTIDLNESISRACGKPGDMEPAKPLWSPDAVTKWLVLPSTVADKKKHGTPVLDGDSVVFKRVKPVRSLSANTPGYLTRCGDSGGDFAADGLPFRSVGVGAADGANSTFVLRLVSNWMPQKTPCNERGTQRPAFRFSGPHNKKYLQGYTKNSGATQHATLVEAQAVALADPTAAGVTKQGGTYTVRKGLALLPDKEGIISWVKAPAADACQKLCRDDPTCRRWLLSPSSDNCYTHTDPRCSVSDDAKGCVKVPGTDTPACWNGGTRQLRWPWTDDDVSPQVACQNINGPDTRAVPATEGCPVGFTKEATGATPVGYKCCIK